MWVLYVESSRGAPHSHLPPPSSKHKCEGRPWRPRVASTRSFVDAPDLACGVVWGMGGGEPGAGRGAWGEHMADKEMEREGQRGRGRRQVVSATRRTRLVRRTESGGVVGAPRMGPSQ